MDETIDSNDPDQTYKPAEIASTLGVSANTIRNWSSRFTEFLSDGANPPKGSPRLFQSRDAAVMAIISAGMKRGETHDEIAASLAKMGDSIPDSMDTTLEPTETATDAPRQTPAPISTVDTIAPLLAAMNASQIKSERIAVVEDRTKQQTGQIQQQQRMIFGLMVAMILILVLLILIILLLRWPV